MTLQPHKRIVVSGASGMLGRAIAAHLERAGHRVERLVRRRASPGEIAWNPDRGEVDRAALEGVDAIVHLSGETIGKRWTDERKHAIVDSRVKTTDLLARTIASLEHKPAVFVCASGVGAYGDTGERLVDERSPFGKGFLADVVRVWEDAAEPARRAAVRVVSMRLGIVLSPDGGVLSEMLLPFSLGVGGPIGSGDQFMSFISQVDAVSAFERAIFDEALSSAVNVVAPEPVRQRVFAKVLGKLLHRPAAIPLPAFAVRALFGEMGQALLLASSRVAPGELSRIGFHYAHPTIEEALSFGLGRAQSAA